MDNISKFFNNLIEGVPSVWKGILLSFCIILFFLYSIGFDVETIKAMYYYKKEKKVELLSKKHKSNPKVISREIKDLFNQLPNVIGVATYGFEPILNPRLTKVIFRVGDDDFMEWQYKDKTSPVTVEPKMFMAHRSGIHYFTDLDVNCSEGVCLGIKSSLSYPLSYRNIVIGNLTLFLGESQSSYDEDEVRSMLSRMYDKSIIIIEDLYYSD